MKQAALLLLIASGLLAGSKPDAIHLAWVKDPSTTMTVVWHTAGGDLSDG